MDRTPLTALALVGLGALLGAGAERYHRESPEVPAQPTADADVADARAALGAAEADLDRLGRALDEAELRLDVTRRERDRAVDQRGGLARRVRTAEEEVLRLRAEVEQAGERRHVLLRSLAEVADALRHRAAEADALAEQARAWRGATTASAWEGFVASAKVAICDRGSRRRHARCNEGVRAVLGPEVEAGFVACVSAGGARPLLRRADGDDGLPDHAVWLERDPRLGAADWFVLLCDPSLPERPTLAGLGGA